MVGRETNDANRRDVGGQNCVEGQFRKGNDDDDDDDDDEDDDGDDDDAGRTKSSVAAPWLKFEAVRGVESTVRTNSRLPNAQLQKVLNEEKEKKRERKKKREK